MLELFKEKCIALFMVKQYNMINVEVSGVIKKKHKLKILRNQFLNILVVKQIQMMFHALGGSLYICVFLNEV